jgi:hypothetical protein
MKYLSIIAIILLSGCSYLNMAPPPSVCDTAPGDSVICRVCGEMGTTPEVADLLLESAALRALDENDKDVVLAFYKDVEYFLQATVSYRALIEYIQRYVNVTGPEIMLISMYLPAFDSTQIISSFDRGLLLTHISNMRAMLE